MHEQNYVINIYYNLFRCSRRSVNRFNELKIFQSIFLFFFKQSFFCIETTFFIFPSHNPSAKRPNENYPVKLFEVGNDSVSETRVQRLLLNFSPIRARRPRCVTQRSLRGKYCFDLYPLSLSLSFDLSLPNQKKFLNRSIGECRAARVMDRFPISKSKYETRWNALISSVQVFVSMNVPQILTPWQTPSRDYVIIET